MEKEVLCSNGCWKLWEYTFGDHYGMYRKWLTMSGEVMWPIPEFHCIQNDQKQIICHFCGWFYAMVWQSTFLRDICCKLDWTIFYWLPSVTHRSHPGTLGRNAPFKHSSFYQKWKVYALLSWSHYITGKWFYHRLSAIRRCARDLAS